MTALTFNYDKASYMANEEIHGKVHVILDKTIHIRGIRIVLNGYEIACWTNYFFHSDDKSERRVIISQEKTLLGREKQQFRKKIKELFNRSEYVELQPGSYEYDFSFKLPEDSPESYSSIFNSGIFYSLKAYIDTPLKIDPSIEKQISVIEPKLEVHETKEISKEVEKRVIFYRKNPIVLTASFNAETFRPGDSLRGKISILNNTKLKPIKLDLYLTEINRLIASKNSYIASDNYILKSFDSMQFESNKINSFDLFLKIPDKIKKSLTSGQLVTRTHFIRVILVVAWASKIEIELPIKIEN